MRFRKGQGGNIMAYGEGFCGDNKWVALKN